MQILAFFSNQKLVIKGNNSCQMQCFVKIALLNVKMYCNLIYKLKLIKQNVTFFSFFSHKN